jgi:hypothetical protein
MKPRNAFVFLGPDFDADEDTAVRFGEELCAWLLKRLGELGATALAEKVDEEGFGWVIDFAVGGPRTFSG